MTNNAPSLQVALVDHAAIVKVDGRANFNTSVTFKRLVTELKNRGFDQFLVDLSDCVTMDSTFLGVLAGFGLKGSVAKPEPGNIAIELLNPNERIMELLESLGVLHLFKVAQGPAQSETVDSSAMTPACPTKEEVTRACLEAHQTLMGLNPQNAAKFKDVAAFLAEDLRKGKSAPEQ